MCRSDWHAWRGHDPVPLPHIPGPRVRRHGSEIGSLVRDVAVGTRVTAPFVNGCGVCAWCRGGDAQVCPEQTQPGFTHPGSFADYVVVRAADFNLVAAARRGGRGDRRGPGLPVRHRLPRPDRARRGRPGDEVAVFGCGGVGLSAVMIAVALGARVTAVDLSAPALDRAAELGAAVTIRSADPVARSWRPPAAAPTCPSTHSVPPAPPTPRCAACAAAARTCRSGSCSAPQPRAPLPWDRVIAWELTVVGSHGMAAADYPPMLELVAEGRLRPGRLVGSVVDLAGAIDALVAMDGPVAGAGGIVVARP